MIERNVQEYFFIWVYYALPRGVSFSQRETTSFQIWRESFDAFNGIEFNLLKP